VFIGTVDPMPFRGFGDHELESRYASSPDAQNAKSQKHLMHKAVVTALGHISERWRKELEQPSSVSEIATRNVEMNGHTNAEMIARSHGINPMVQVNLNKIGGLL
jgi:hypothetical protein